jgi:hypothetical protein
MKFKENESRGIYYFKNCSYLKNENCNELKVVGHWIRDGFSPVKVLGWEPKYPIKSSYIAHLENNTYAVSRQGFNNSWYGDNSIVHLTENFETASQLLESKVNISNRQLFKSAINNILIQSTMLLVFVSVAVCL